MNAYLTIARHRLILSLLQATEPGAIEHLLWVIAVAERNLGMPLN